MSQPLISSLTGMLNDADISRMAAAAGAPEGNILHGFRAALSTIVGSIAGRIDNPGELRRVFDLLANEGGNPFGLPGEFRSEIGSQLFEKGQQLLSIGLGKNRYAVIDEIGKQSSLPASVVAQIMGLAAPMVAALLGRRVQEQAISFDSFPEFLLHETGDLSNCLPLSLRDLVRVPEPVEESTRPVAVSAPPITRSSGGRWMRTALIAAVLLGVVWIRGRSPSMGKAATPAPAADATRARMTWPELGRRVDRDLPGDVRLQVPENGMETKLIAYIEDSSRSAGDDRWFDFDRLTFDTNSAIPRPESEEQLANIASVLKAYPAVRLKIGGYTDARGNRQANQRLSENRALSVLRELVGMGVDSRRLDAEGYGGQHAIADNATEQGRAKNRRISLKVLQK